MRKITNSEKGLSLIEVVASILLISIILLSFFGLFIQSKKTGVASEKIVDATYAAQIELEDLYSVISNNNIYELEEYLTAQSYSSDILLTDSLKVKSSCFKQEEKIVAGDSVKTLDGNSLSGHYEKETEQYSYMLTFKKVCNTQGLYLVTIEVLDLSSNTKSFMEAAYFIGGS